MLTAAGVGAAMMKTVMPRLGAGRIMAIMMVKEIIGIMGGVSPYPQLPLLGGAGWRKGTKGGQLPTTMAGAGARKAGGKSGVTRPNKTNRIMSRPPAAAGAGMTAQTMTTGIFDSVVKKLLALWVGGRADIRFCKIFSDLWLH